MATRRGDLLHVLRREHPSSQQDIVKALRDRGHEVTQATVSRDLRRVGAVKVRTAAGFAYRLPDDVAGTPTDDLLQRRLQQFLRDFIVDVKTAGNLVIVLTPPGSAGVVARAIDQASMDDVVGSIAGDDTIFVAAPSGMAARGLARLWLNGDGATTEVAP